jgi:hypothetical protein
MQDYVNLGLFRDMDGQVDNSGMQILQQFRDLVGTQLLKKTQPQLSMKPGNVHFGRGREDFLSWAFSDYLAQRLTE